MKHQATKNLLASVVIDPASFRFPQATDRFKIELTTDARQYLVINKTRFTQRVVTFSVSASGRKLASCTCPDFANIRKHGRQCKHIHVAYGYHIGRMKAMKVAEHVQATTAPMQIKEVVEKRASGDFVAGIRISYR